MTGDFTPADHLADVLASFDSCPDPRLRRVMQALVGHLHAFVAEVGLTDDEWLAGIRFLTEAGQLSDDHRQELILLSDTLGVSMLVEMINHAAADGTTEPSVLGPFRAATGRSASVITEYIGIYERTRGEFPAAPRLLDLLDAEARRMKKGGGGEHSSGSRPALPPPAGRANAAFAVALQVLARVRLRQGRGRRGGHRR
jgi:hypothetical protein